MERKDWIIKIKNELDSMADLTTEVWHWKKRSIYRVPPSVIDLNKKAYKPQIASLGPYHHGEDHLKAMEEHKHRALLHSLKRSGKSIDVYVDALAEVADDLKDAYDQLDSKWQLEEFLELMILDGCFILEIVLTATQTLNDYAPNDPIFGDHGKIYIVPYLKRDMLMLENQLPLLVLEKLVSVEKENSERGDKIVKKRILDFFSRKPVGNMGKCLHILDIYRKSLLGEPPQEKQRKKSHRRAHQLQGQEDEIIRSAAELNEAGIRIKKNKTRSLKDISFHRGVLELPQILVDDITESMYLNLIAFERLHVGAGNEVTSYIFFMDNIMESARDVSLLHSSGIIQNAMGSDETVAQLFNSLSKDVTLDPESRLGEVHMEVSYYCKKPWNAWRADIMHNYFRNPWAILSVVAAIFLFALTTSQTVYSVLSYAKS